MEQRNSARLELPAICRIAPASRRRLPLWKRVENISGSGVLLLWSEGEPAAAPPAIGSRYVAELPLPTHPAFGERTLELDVKVVRIVRKADGRIMAAFRATARRFKVLRPGAWRSATTPDWVN